MTNTEAKVQKLIRKIFKKKSKYKCKVCKDTGEYEVSAGTHSFYTQCDCKKEKK